MCPTDRLIEKSIGLYKLLRNFGVPFDDIGYDCTPLVLNTRILMLLF